MSTLLVSAPPTLALRRYQQDALTAIEAAAARGVRRALLVLATGLGKTIVFAELIGRRPGRGLVLVHRDELVRQAVDKLALVAPLGVGVVKAERDEVDAGVVVASVQTLARETRLRRLRPDFTTVVVDEAHHLAAETYQRVLEHLGVGAEAGPLALGATATPERGDGLPLEGWETVYRKDILDGIRAGYLADLRAVQIRLAADFTALHVRAGDFIDRETETLLLEANAPEHAVAAYRQHAPGRKALLFTPTVKVAHAMADAFRASGITAEAIDGGTPLEIRREILGRFHTGAVRVVANCGVLTEGFDEPSADCVIVARPTRSRLLYMQMLGRGTRLFPGKSDCLVIDLVGATDRHDIMTAAAVLQVRSRSLTQRGALAAAAEREAEEAHRAQAARGELVSEAIDLFRPHPPLPREGLHWVKTGGGRFALSLESATLILAPTPDDRWRVLRRDRAGTQCVADGLPLEYAQGAAEDYARKAGASTLITSGAAWRSTPASERQVALLRRWRVPVPDGLTKGAAADLITARIAVRA